MLEPWRAFCYTPINHGFYSMNQLKSLNIENRIDAIDIIHANDYILTQNANQKIICDYERRKAESQSGGMR